MSNRSTVDVGALLALTRSLIVRFVREGFVLRALIWPGAICAATIVVTASVYAIWGKTPDIAVSNAAIAQRFEAAKFNVTISDDPEAALIDGDAVRAVWMEGDVYVFGHAFEGVATLKAESVARDIAQSAWRIEVPALKGRPADVDPQTRLMAGVIGLLYALYGTVMGAGSVFRDRTNGSLEGERSLPVPTWMHGAARLLALTGILTTGLAGSLLMLHAVLPIHRIGEWILQGAVASATAGAIGLAVMVGSGRASGFSAPLTRAMGLSLLVLGFGWALPEIGQWIPLASLAALVRGYTSFVGPPLLTLAATAAATVYFGRKECL